MLLVEEYIMQTIYIEKTKINLYEYHNTDINTNCHPDDIKIEGNLVNMRTGEIITFTINKRYIKSYGSYTKINGL